MGFFRAVVRAALLLLVGAGPALAQDVMLTSRDGAVEVSGNLLSFDGEFYRVETDYGELTLDGSGVLCDGPGCPDLEAFVAELSISGAATIGGILMPALVEGFGLRHGYLVARRELSPGRVLYSLTNRETGRLEGEFTIHSANTDAGFDDLMNADVDIVMALREIRPEELKAARDAGLGDLTQRGRSRVLALDALVPIVAPGNPVTRISLTDLAAVLSGQIDNWADLGGPDAPIDVHVRDLASGIGQAVYDQLLVPAGTQLARTAVQHDNDAELRESVLGDPFAMGVASGSEVGDAQPLGLGGACGFALQATNRNAKTEDYPLTAPVFLYQPARRLPKLAREFLAYTRSDQAQYVIRRAGFGDQLPEEIPMAEQGTRIANAIDKAGPEISLEELQRMVRTLRDMTRLSTSFRFRAGSSQLDAQSRSNVALLAQALESGQYDNREVLLVGFSDGEGGAEANRTIAERRAQAVLNAVLANAEALDAERVTLRIEAFGEALPMACDDSAWGRQANRRVEVWVR